MDRDEGARGLFVVFEGGDGAGKTTQLDMLERRLRADGRTVERTREPGGTDIGERIRSLVLDHGQGEVDPRTEALLFAASRAAHVTQRILPALESGAVVLCDRFVDSSIAYQGVGRGLGADDVARVNAWATQGLRPDLTVLLDVDHEVSAARRTSRGGAADRMESADAAFHRRLREAFLDRAAEDPTRYLVVDASGPADDIHAAVVDELREVWT
ncbi:MAG: dTMP kinase [Nesterenkonia sp.]|uniref:dTMP kinase n=1 Tax=Nesterenkonia marinintestina TaxID=2979865 RepID=UPI0021C19C11|nr:dTMP kinase [Nesterenkonia sp. GX14115]MDO5493363.1 dTMP kinase [Nesterenkonia sp.]